MGSQETMNPTEHEGLRSDDREGDSDLASKLSKELSNWRRKRGSGGFRAHDERPIIAKAPLSEPARTIKVRGHETLVIRRPKVVSKPRPENPPRE
jgi:hypothetical protein